MQKIIVFFIIVVFFKFLQALVRKTALVPFCSVSPFLFFNSLVFGLPSAGCGSVPPLCRPSCFSGVSQTLLGCFDIAKICLLSNSSKLFCTFSYPFSSFFLFSSLFLAFRLIPPYIIYKSAAPARMPRGVHGGVKLPTGFFAPWQGSRQPPLVAPDLCTCPRSLAPLRADIALAPSLVCVFHGIPLPSGVSGGAVPPLRSGRPIRLPGCRRRRPSSGRSR